MFGMTAVTAFELEAERRRELAMAYRPPRAEIVSRREFRPTASLRRFIGSLRQIPAGGLEDLRT